MDKVLSIIIPVYNCERFLEKCLESIIDKRYLDDYEIILVNDGSQDGSLDICNQYACNYKNIKVVNQENQGVSAARNAGINCSEGRYITFVDSDDFVAKEYIKEIFEIVKEDVQLIVFNNYLVDESGNNQKIEKDYDELSIDHVYIREEMLRQKLNAPWDKVFLRSVIQDNHITFQLNLSLGEDFLFNLNYFNHVTKVKYLNKPIYYHVNNQNSLCNSAQTLYRIEQFCYMYQYAYDIIKKWDCDIRGFMSENLKILFSFIYRMERKLINFKRVRAVLNSTGDIKTLVDYNYSSLNLLRRNIIKILFLL